MDIGTTLLLLVGVGLIVAAGTIRRRSLKAHDAAHAAHSADRGAPAPREEG